MRPVQCGSSPNRAFATRVLSSASGTRAAEGQTETQIETHAIKAEPVDNANVLVRAEAPGFEPGMGC